jgi:phosphopantetheinyl transferase (holo-ACP synthase)
VQTELPALRNEVTGLATKAESMKTNFGGLSSEVSLLKAWTLFLPRGPAESLIFSDFADIFAEFRGKRFSLLWRGSRDGFGAADFHGRCDGHANTLTVILDTNGNVFGGFTPVEWESTEWNGKFGKESNYFKADDSLRSFVFTLKNPHNIPARRFALKAEAKWTAIYCHSNWGPHFRDIYVSHNCNANTDSWTELGNVYTNDTGLNGKTVFTGSLSFQVKEIEVFEITE